jgi:hypothetical protein
MASVNNMTDKIDIGQKHIKTEDRRQNIRVVKGLIRDFFVKADVANLGHGPGMIFDFENSLRRARTETPSMSSSKAFFGSTTNGLWIEVY